MITSIFDKVRRWASAGRSEPDVAYFEALTYLAKVLIRSFAVARLPKSHLDKASLSGKKRGGPSAEYAIVSRQKSVFCCQIGVDVERILFADRRNSTELVSESLVFFCELANYVRRAAGGD